MLLALLTSGCAARTSAVGLLQIDEGAPVLLRDAEMDLKLRPGKRSEAIPYLGGCTVDVSGPQLGRTVWVRDWSVVTAYDGSEPFVGVVGRVNGMLALDDRNSGSVFLLEEDSAAPLVSYEGELVLVMGFVVGPQLLQIMGYRVLGPD